MAKNDTKQSAQESQAADGAAKVAKFKELGEKRVGKAVKALENVAALGNPRAYTYDNRQKEIVLNALANAMEKVKAAFDGKPVKSSTTLGL